MGHALKIVTVVGRKELSGPEAERARIEASYGLKASQAIAEQHRSEQRARSRFVDVDDRVSVKRAMRAVEARIVEAVWTLARLPGGGNGSGSCGIAYIHDAADRWANAIEKGWEVPLPRPARPSPRAIDAMYEPLGWLSLLPRPQAMLVSVAATTKCGDVDRTVSWRRVRKSLAEAQTLSIDTLHRRYTGGIRAIVACLTEKALTEKV